MRPPHHREWPSSKCRQRPSFICRLTPTEQKRVPGAAACYRGQWMGPLPQPPDGVGYRISSA